MQELGCQQADLSFGPQERSIEGSSVKEPYTLGG